MASTRAAITNDYPEEWDSIRRRIYKRDNYTCRNCGARGGRGGNAELHAHHIVPKSKGGVHDDANLVTLCEPCHDAIHKRTKLAPTAHTTAESAGKPGWGRWWIHALLLITTLGIGNIFYLCWRWLVRISTSPAH